MINSHYIIQTETVCNSFYPPFISGIAMHFPVVQWISPELSCCRKSVRRATCNLYRTVFFIEFKEPWICPCVSTVHCHIDRNVTDDPDAIFICIRFEFHPLLAEFELHILLKFDFKIHFFSVIIECILPAKTDVLSPFAPRNTAEAFLHCHKKCIVLQPPCLFFLKSAEFRIYVYVAAFICFTEQNHTSFI